MAPSLAPNSETPSQADTPMTDANDEPVTSVPVDDAQMGVGDRTRSNHFRTSSGLRALMSDAY